MNSKRKDELVRKFLKWLNMNRCIAEVHLQKHRVSEIKVCEVVRVADGKRTDTLCYETMDANRTDVECWLEVLSRRCRGDLLFDRFSMFGLGQAASLEELELKLEVCGC